MCAVVVQCSIKIYGEEKEGVMTLYGGGERRGNDFVCVCVWGVWVYVGGSKILKKLPASFTTLYSTMPYFSWYHSCFGGNLWVRGE